MKEGRVLVVDDEPMVRETLGQVLTDEGYVVDLAVDGETALERVQANCPDAVLLDLMMPGMNGRQFLQALRAEPAYANVSVLIMTAVHGLEVNLATLGASEVVEKPFKNVDELLNKVALAVYRSRHAERPITQPLPTLQACAVVLDEENDAAILRFGSRLARRRDERRVGDAVGIARSVDGERDLVEQVIDVEWFLDDLARADRRQVDLEAMHGGHDQHRHLLVRGVVA